MTLKKNSGTSVKIAGVFFKMISIPLAPFQMEGKMVVPFPHGAAFALQHIVTKLQNVIAKACVLRLNAFGEYLVFTQVNHIFCFVQCAVERTGDHTLLRSLQLHGAGKLLVARHSDLDLNAVFVIRPLAARRLETIPCTRYILGITEVAG